MKMKNIIFYATAILTLLLVVSCSEEEFVDNPSGEVFIYRLNIVNGGLSGTENIKGTLNEAAKSIAFTAPAESDIQAVKFQGKLSLGAKLDRESYDFTSGSADVKVINGENIGVYKVNLTLNAPTQTPILSKVVVKDAAGAEKEAFVSELDKTVYLKSAESNSVEIVSIECLPRRTQVTFTNAENNVISKDNPGKLLMDFMGLKNEYRILFGSNPVFGADFNLGTVYDFTPNALGADMWPDYSGENTRSTAFDGETLLIVSRQGGLNPKVLKFADIKAGSPAEKILNTTGVEGGAHVISAGRLAHKHIYICNLTTGVSAEAPLKIYHWANEDATPEVLVTFDGVATNADMNGTRLGDNISVDLDEQGNGYIFLLPQNGDQILRFDVQGFTTLTNPTHIVPTVTAPYYASVNKVYGTDNEYVYTSTQAPIVIIDKDGTELFKLEIDDVPVQATDARIITYDAERYLIMTTGRRTAWSKDPVQVFYVYNISEGANTMIAMSNFAASEKVPVFTYSLDGNGASAPSANTGWGISPEGNLLLMTSATKTGFAIIEFPEKQ